MMLELPPTIRRSEQQQLRELRDYLVRLVQKLNEESSQE